MIYDWRLTLGQTAPAGGIPFKKCGLRLFDAVRRPRPSPVPGRAAVSGPLFPGFCFVGFSGHPPGILHSLPSISFILRHEKGRPLNIPGERIGELKIYCNATSADTIPDDLRILDVLAFEDRLSHLVDWLQTPSQDSRGDVRGTGARKIVSRPALVQG